MAKKDKKKSSKKTLPTPKKASKPFKITGSFRLVASTFRTLRSFWRPLGGILVVYLLINLLFATGLGAVIGPTDGSTSGWSSRLDSVSSQLVANNDSQANSAMQTVFFVIFSLATIWALRQLLAGKSVGVKQAYYSSTGPLIPFVLVLVLIFIQLLPLALGLLLAGATVGVLQTGLIINLIVIGVFFLLAALSIFWLSSSILALYITTLPGMQPRQALRSAKKLVKFRRLAILRRMFFLPLLGVIITAVALVPFILWAPVVAPLAFYLLGGFWLLFGHAYLYGLYRSLLP